MKKQLQYLKLFLPALLIITALSSPAQQEFTLTTTPANITSSRALIDLPGLSGNTLAIIVATPLGNTKALNPHPTGVWYYSGKWNLFNSNHNVLIPGLTYKVQYFLSLGPNQFLHLVTQENLGSEGSYIDNPALNNHPNVQFTIFQNHSPDVRSGSSLNRFEAKAGYSTAAGRWYITNIAGQPLYKGAAYNIVISNEGNAVTGPIKANPDIVIKDPKTIIKPADTVQVITGPLDKKDIVTKKPIAPSYDFSNVHICIEEVTNKSLPPKTPVTPVPVIPKIKPNGEIEPVTTVTQPLSVATDLMWTSGENITVGFLPGETITVITKVKKYAKEWETYANIRFVFTNDVSQAKIKVGFKKDGTSWSWMGRDVLVNQSEGRTMNLGWLDDHTSESEFRKVVLHEFGHALGFIHEHQSPAAGIPWDTAKVYSYFGGSPNYWNRSKVNQNVLNKYSVTRTNSSTYDKFSIMHYYYPAYLTKDSSTFPENTNLSVVDKAFVSKVYPYPPGPATSKGVLLTGDDCDEIEFTVEYNVVNINEVVFILEPGRDQNNNIITWWKKIAIPLKGGVEAGMEMQDGYSANLTLSMAGIDETKGIAFGKAKLFGVHTRLGYTWKVWPAIRGGCRITFVWRRDKCG